MSWVKVACVTLHSTEIGALITRGVVKEITDILYDRVKITDAGNNEITSAIET